MDVLAQIQLPLARLPGNKIDWPLEQMRHLYEIEGWTLQRIADFLGQNQKVVNKVAKRNGFQMRRTGPASGEGHPKWKGGRNIDKDGYVLIYRPGHPSSPNGKKYVREHRLVMEQVLGRYLLPTEVVHHVNGCKTDNRPENLEVFQSNGEHLSETLRGKCPNWTPEGRERILHAVRNRQPCANQNSRQQESHDSESK